jgi:putative restriction endonuclease
MSDSGKSIIAEYIKKFQHLHVDKKPGCYSVGKAPHKPVLLLAMIALDKANKANLAHIVPDINLRDTWAELWQCLDYPRPGPINLPLYHLRSEGFWDLQFRKGVTPHQPKSIGQYEEMVEFASLDPELVGLLKDNNNRNTLENALLNGGYFSENEILKLKDKLTTLDSSFRYEKLIHQLIDDEFKPKPHIGEMVLEPTRNPAFRRSILTAYGEACSICGMKIITSSGISAVDAAHILPFAEFKNDDIRNGLALCKLHHWLFDGGLISVDERYRVLVSSDIIHEMPDKIISGIAKSEILLPKLANEYPAPVALEWHRKNRYIEK